MAKVTARQKVYRAEFLNWIQPTSAGQHIERGGFIVEVCAWPYTNRGWAAMINGDRGRVLCICASAAKSKAAARRHFQNAKTDWVEGVITDGQWRPLAAEGVA